jgi:hypothetical protein
MSVITHFPRDSEHCVTCIDQSINASLAQNQRARVMSAAHFDRRKALHFPTGVYTLVEIDETLHYGFSFFEGA